MPFTNEEDVLNDINVDSIEEMNRFINAMRPILLEESGYREVTRTVTLDEALKRATRRQRDDLDWYKRDMDEIQAALDSGFQGGTFGTAAGRERGHGVGRFTREGLQKHLEGVKRDYDKIVSDLTTVRGFEKTDEAKAADARWKALEEKQLALNEAQLARAKAVLEDPNFRGSDVLQTAVAKDFQAFKEAQARAGNIIMGDSIDNAVGMGSAATESLRAFKDNVNLQVEREKNTIIHGETPLAYQGFGIASGAYGARANALPQAPNYGGLSASAIGAFQPFQFNRQMDFARDQFEYQKGNDARNRRTMMISGLLNSGITAGAMMI